MILNRINGKKYIGITTNSFPDRYPHGIQAHHNPHLRKSVKKYGQKSFEAVLLEKNIEDMKTLCELETKYIEKYDACNPEKGYNKSLGGLGVRQIERTKEHCLNLSRAKKGINPLKDYTPEQMAIRNAKLSKSLSGENNPMYGMTKDKLKPATLEKLKQASLGKNNPMYGKNIKDFMTPESYESWKQNVANHGAKNGRARKAVVIYKGQRYDFDYAQEAIDYFKSKGEHITRYWFYKGVNDKYKQIFQFVGYLEDYKNLTGNKLSG